MAIPPFPSHDLAKLVLGYLAEEQLMTAYDEFLQASPYLDVLKNEYDRIFMTSLKNILAEYRAVKIFVETCKPFLLRKKIIQCPNLLEVVKLLVSNIDINKLLGQDFSGDKSCISKQTSYHKSNGCDVCNSLNLASCVCSSKVTKTAPMEHNMTSKIEASSIETSIETTSLADLPGNSVTKWSSNRDTDNVITHSSNSSVDQTDQTDTTVKSQNDLTSTSVESQPASEQNIQNDAGLMPNKQDIILEKCDESKQKIEEFNTILNLVCSKNNSTNSPSSNIVPENSTNKLISNAGTFQEFSTGVTGNTDKDKPTVPDSSTSENFNPQAATSNEIGKKMIPITNIKGPPIAQYLLKAGTINNPCFQMVREECQNISKSFDPLIKIKPNSEEQKITILSDVKVDNVFKSNKHIKMTPVLKSSISSPMLQKQTIFINGTPAYKHKHQNIGTSYSFTKDEIMAMPTIILVPSSGTTQIMTASSSRSTVSCVTNTITTTTHSSPRVFGPLVIDVPSTNTIPTPSVQNMPELNSEDPKITSEGSLIKTVEGPTHASLPKDTNHTDSHKTSTPNVLPPTRKSSSTPRRNSHVRVLDFATPRRILHETLNDHDPNKLGCGSDGNEISTTETPGIPVHTNIITNIDKHDTSGLINKSKSASTKENKSKSASTKENKSKSVKRNNWDAELRALALGKSDCDEPVVTKPKHKKTKKKKVSTVSEKATETSEADNKSKSSLEKKSNKKKSNKAVEAIEEPIKQEIDEKTENINIVADCDGNVNEIQTVNNVIKVNTSDDDVNTPEAERLSLQNVIGAKLNISDLLETPYKQALYDIQMETPKFLGADLPGEPISDIKIMSIPTPRFLNTPKPLQATPSSYSSRPTDYSSGGSYYKPDDQDYMLPSEVLQCEVKAAVEETSKSIKKESAPLESKKNEKSERPSRPQRKCTKNVSYKSPSICKTKDDETFEVASISSETSNKSAKDNKIKSESKARLKSKNKPDKKRVIAYKSPLKLKNFMIKPRRTTPVKKSSNRERKKTSDNAENNHLKSRKRTTSKDKLTNTTPVVTTAPTKSRRKSSTPRKLECTKSYNSEVAVENTSNVSKNEQGAVKETNVQQIPDSDSEQQPLLWSDDGSQDAKLKDEQPSSSSIPDEDDIVKIKEYIETSAPLNKTSEGSLHIDLINRGFDVETAKSIERDLLDITPIQDTAVQSTSNEEIPITKPEVSLLPVTQKVESDSSTANNSHTVQDENAEEYEEVELSVHECDEMSENFVSCQFDETKFVPGHASTLKDKFSMELCIDDDVTIRLRAGPFISVFDVDPELDNQYNTRETEEAVSSISNIDKLYTPMKDRRIQCYEIFDSTLTSIDTPLKTDVTTYETKVTDIVLEVESVDFKDRTESKKRKRLQSGNLEESLSKKSKPEAQYLLNSASIQNIDIESVLSKLHGP